MGYSIAMNHEERPGRWTITVRVNLSRAEANELFLSGDSMLSWPAEGLANAGADDPIPERSGMFISQIATQPSGLVIQYAQQAQAERTLQLLRAQLAQAGIDEEE